MSPFTPRLWASAAHTEEHAQAFERRANLVSVLVIDAANVIGSRPTGWWRDRAGAARNFVAQVREATRYGRLPPPAVVVLEGAARAGVDESDIDGVLVVHAAQSGDDTLVAHAGDDSAIVVTADRRLRERVRELGAEVVSPGWLYVRLTGTKSN